MNLGQVYTKEIIADFMVDLMGLPKKSSVVDPCFGKGVFIKSLIKKGYSKITGIEIDSETYDSIDLNKFQGCTLINDDFFNFEFPTPVDGFILNPPYVRQEEIDDMDSLGVTKRTIQSKCGDIHIYSKANLYLYFIARCITLLKNDGALVAIFPNAWLNTPDGKDFVLQIENHGYISDLIQVNGYPFIGNPLVDVMILKFIKNGNGRTNKKTISILDERLTIEETNSEITFESPRCVQLSTISTIRRGVTTGYNQVFINPSIADNNNTIDILSTPKNVIGYSTQNAKLDRMLSLSGVDELSTEIKEYLKRAESAILKEGKPKTIVNAIREKKNWYTIKVPNPSQLIFPYIIRDSVRFILNESEVVARDNFYTISSSTCNSLLLMALLNNLFVYSQLEICGKSYGNGLLKIQKYDVDNIVVPSPSIIEEDIKEQLISYAKSLVKTQDYKYILEITRVLSRFYHIDNIYDIYKLQKNNRLKYEMQSC